MTECRQVSHDATEPLPAIVPMRQADLSRVSFSWSSRFDSDSLEDLLTSSPGLTLWVPATGEYVVGGPWRHRSEIVSILDLVATGNAVRLLRALAGAAAANGRRLLIASEHHETRKQEFYASAGFELIEEILIYELSRVRIDPPQSGALRFERINVDDPAALHELIALDHAAFPWLWWNSAEEFDNYGHSPGVDIYLGRDRDGAALSYIGVTRFRTWGHLDRIAVVPDHQGAGLGWLSLDFAVFVLGQAGARRVALSTQARNSVSRRLYERYGFRRNPSQDYCLYGRWLGDRSLT